MSFLWLRTYEIRFQEAWLLSTIITDRQRYNLREKEWASTNIFVGLED